MPAPVPNPYTRRSERLLRLRRAVAVALVVGAAAVVAVYLVQRRHRRPVEAPVLGLEVQQSAAGVDISKTVGGRPVFRVYASRAVKLRTGGVVELRKVRILVYDHDGKHADVINGDAFRYDETTGELEARGAVDIELASQVHILAQGLTYNVKQGTGAVAQGAQFTLGTARGSAGTVALNSRTGVADFSGGIHVDWARPRQPELHLASSQAELERLTSARNPAPENGWVRVRLEGKAQVQQGARTLSAQTLTAYVDTHYALRHLDASGDVRAREGSGANAMRLTAASAHAYFSGAAQKLVSLDLGGGVSAEQRAAGNGGIRSLRADQLALSFSPPNVLQTMQARGHAQLIESGVTAEQVSAPQLDFAFSGARPAPQLSSMSSRGRTEIVRGPLRLAADQATVTLAANQQPRLALASGNVVAHQTVPGGERVSQCQWLQVRFAPGVGPAAQAEQITERGDVRLRQADRRLAADQAVYTVANATALLTGHVHGSSAQGNFAAGTLRWRTAPDGRSTMLATAAPQGRVSVSLETRTSQAAAAQAGSPLLTPGQPVVVTADAVHWNQPPADEQESAGASSRAGAFRPRIQPRPDAEDAGGGRPAGGRRGEAPAKGGASRPQAAAFRGTVVFTGLVRMLDGPDLLRADHVTVSSGAAGPSLAASGHVSTAMVSSGSSVLTPASAGLG
ncbi:MAG: hypothetical protein ACRD1Y_10490, partial [Terriglobales bacterium]